MGIQMLPPGQLFREDDSNPQKSFLIPFSGFDYDMQTMYPQPFLLGDVYFCLLYKSPWPF